MVLKWQTHKQGTSTKFFPQNNNINYENYLVLWNILIEPTLWKYTTD